MYSNRFNYKIAPNFAKLTCTVITEICTPIAEIARLSNFFFFVIFFYYPFVLAKWSKERNFSSPFLLLGVSS